MVGIFRQHLSNSLKTFALSSQTSLTIYHWTSRNVTAIVRHGFTWHTFKHNTWKTIWNVLREKYGGNMIAHSHTHTHIWSCVGCKTVDTVSNLGSFSWDKWCPLFAKESKISYRERWHTNVTQYSSSFPLMCHWISLPTVQFILLPRKKENFVQAQTPQVLFSVIMIMFDVNISFSSEAETKGVKVVEPLLSTFNFSK